MLLVRVLAVPYINSLCWEAWGRYHCVCIVVIDLICVLDLL